MWCFEESLQALLCYNHALMLGDKGVYEQKSWLAFYHHRRYL